MLFSSLPFLFYFLPRLDLILESQGRNAALLLCSLVFYAWASPDLCCSWPPPFRAMPPPGSWS